MKEDISSMRISKENRERLANFGRAGDSLDTALSRALDLAEKYKNV